MPSCGIQVSGLLQLGQGTFVGEFIGPTATSPPERGYRRLWLKVLPPETIALIRRSIRFAVACPLTPARNGGHFPLRVIVRAQLFGRSGCANRQGPFHSPFQLFEVPDIYGVRVLRMRTTSKGAGSSQGGSRRTRVSSEELLGALSEIEQKYAPERLFVSGKIELPLPHPRVAIIGTRKPSDEGLRIASRLSKTLAQQGVIIVSGLALGIDTAAHTAAIEAGGRTIAVLGTPLSQTYPRANAELQSFIMRSHLAVSQFDERHPTTRTNFVVRNRTMALIADASVIVESGEGGGSLHQGWEALRLGRPLFIHTREFAKPGLEWPRKMADYGAVKFKEPSDIFEFVPSAGLNLAVAAFDSA